jgi:hypothetical protein
MSGVLGLLAYLSILGTFFWICWRLIRRLPGLRESLLAIALVAIVLGHIGEGLVGIAIVSTLVMLWTCFSLASVMYRMFLAGGETAELVAEPAAPAAAPAGRPAPPRTRAARPAAAPNDWEHVTGGRMVIALGAAALGIVAIVGLGVLFFTNYRVVSADVVFKDALNYEQAADSYANQAHSLLSSTQTTGAGQTASSSNQQQVAQNLNAAFQYFNQAISLFQASIDQQPSQDFYYLYYGKTLLEKVQADRDANNTAWRDQDVKQAESILLQAQRINPLDTDHSANLGRLYSMWAQWDPTKYPLSLQWFDKAVHLSPHHSRLFDEYGLSAARNYGQYLASAGKASEATAMYRKAADLFKHAATIDPQLSDAFALWGDTEFIPQFLNDGRASIYPYTQALKLLPAGATNIPAIEVNLGIAYFRDVKDYKQAQAYASRAMSDAGALIKTQTSNPAEVQQLQSLYSQAYTIYNQATTALKKKK